MPRLVLGDSHPYESNIPAGLTHLPDEPCPFHDDNFAIGMMATCCSYRGKAAARELEALREDRLAEGMYQDMTSDEAITFANQLRAAADRLERYHADGDKPVGAGWNGTYDPKTGETTWGLYSTFEEALAEIRNAARWYEKVGSMGFGVHAWY